MELHQTSGRWRVGLGLSLFAVFLWGILPIAVAVTLQVLDVYTVTWFRFAISFGVLAAYLTVSKQLPTLQKLRKASLKLLAIGREPTRSYRYNIFRNKLPIFCTRIAANLAY
jgi:EamA domain-containing membrane protein RarD